jgi:hypothetical protein
MKNLKILFSLLFIFSLFIAASCENQGTKNRSAEQEQAHTEMNQAHLNQVQPPPTITWSLERDNLIRRFKLQNDRAVMFYMYIFIEGVADPVGYYQVNKISSVNSQLTNPMQLVKGDVGERDGDFVLPSPAEDGSYGENGDAVFGFTPEDIYIEHNMHYVVSTVPLSFKNPVIRLTVINVKTQQELKTLMDKIN